MTTFHRAEILTGSTDQEPADLLALALADFDTTQVIEGFDASAFTKTGQVRIWVKFWAASEAEARAAAKRAARALRVPADVLFVHTIKGA